MVQKRLTDAAVRNVLETAVELLQDADEAASDGMVILNNSVYMRLRTAVKEATGVLHGIAVNMESDFAAEKDDDDLDGGDEGDEEEDDDLDEIGDEDEDLDDDDDDENEVEEDDSDADDRSVVKTNITPARRRRTG